MELRWLLIHGAVWIFSRACRLVGLLNTSCLPGLARPAPSTAMMFAFLWERLSKQRIVCRRTRHSAVWGIVGTHCGSKGHRRHRAWRRRAALEEIYSVFTFFLIHCPANTAITAAAHRGCKSVPGDEKRPPRRQAAPGESEDDLWKKTQHLGRCTPTAWQLHIFFCVVIRPLKGTVHPISLTDSIACLLTPDAGFRDFLFTTASTRQLWNFAIRENMANGCLPRPRIPTQLNNGRKAEQRKVQCDLNSWNVFAPKHPICSQALVAKNPLGWRRDFCLSMYGWICSLQWIGLNFLFPFSPFLLKCPFFCVFFF